MIREERVKELNDNDVEEGYFVLYWMQRSQRAEFNPALEYAITRANEIDLPLVVYFGLTDDFSQGNERHFRFMLGGLKKTQEELKRRSIQLVLRRSAPPRVPRN